ncbi:hypothetical protein FRC12_013441 [Ceratobasidium sp. 428]|nr:hypothetical protein FRC12_013441 [Ceratobasidium sp. 428]
MHLPIGQGVGLGGSWACDGIGGSPGVHSWRCARSTRGTATFPPPKTRVDSSYWRDQQNHTHCTRGVKIVMAARAASSLLSWSLLTPYPPNSHPVVDFVAAQAGCALPWCRLGHDEEVATGLGRSVGGSESGVRASGLEMTVEGWTGRPGRWWWPRRVVLIGVGA